MGLSNAERQAAYRERRKETLAREKADREAAEGLAVTTLEFVKRVVHYYFAYSTLTPAEEREHTLFEDGKKILETAARSGRDRDFQWSAAMRVKGARETPVDKIVTKMKRKADTYDRIAELVRGTARKEER